MDDNVKTILKIAAIGVGAYILYNFLVNNGIIPSLFGGAALPPGTPAPQPQPPVTGTGTGTGTSTGTQTATPPPTTPAGVTAAQLLAAAGQGASYTANVDVWNYYERQVNPAAVVSDMGIAKSATDRGPAMTAPQYIAARQTAGLSGLTPMFATYPSGLPGWNM